MRVSRDYVFDLIEKFGRRMQEAVAGQTTTSYYSYLTDALWGVQRELAQREITPKEAARRLLELSEKATFMGKDWRTLLRGVAL